MTNDCVRLEQKVDLTLAFHFTSLLNIILEGPNMY